MIKYSPTGAGHITEAINRAIKMAEISKEEVELEFNGDTVVVYENHNSQVYSQWSTKRAKRQSGDNGNG